jgi:NADP-dependent 3-hydroxy acid dehydrogenase YdfG
MAARAEKDWGRVDILVNNAGVLRARRSRRWTWRISSSSSAYT